MYQPGEEGRLTSSAGGVATQVIDPNLKDSYTNEIAAWVEREVIADFGVRTGLVYRTERNLAVAYNQNRPFDAYTVPVTIQDPGPDGRVGNADDGSAYTGYNLSAAALALPIVNTYGNVDGARSDYYTFELTGTKRMSHNWSAMLSFSKTWSAAQNNTFFGTGFRQNALRGLAAGPDQHRVRRADQVHRLVAQVERHLRTGRGISRSRRCCASRPGRTWPHVLTLSNT